MGFAVSFVLSSFFGSTGIQRKKNTEVPIMSGMPKEQDRLPPGMRGAGVSDATVVGEVVKDHPGKIFVY